MGGRGGMDRQRAHVADVGQMAVQLEGLDEGPARRRAAADPEGQHGTGAGRQVARRRRVPAAGLQPRVGDPQHVVAALKPARHRQRVLRVPLYPQRQRLQPLQQQEGVDRRQRRAEIAQQLRPGPHDVGGLREGLEEHQPVVGRIRAGEPWVTPVAPVEPAAVDDDPADGRAVPADELRRRVHDHVGAVLERAGQVRGGQGVVDDERRARLVRGPGHPGDVEDVPARVADRLPVEGGRVRAHGGLPGTQVVGVVDEGRLDAELGERVGEQRVRPAVQRRRRDQMIAGGGDGEDRQRLRRLAAGHRQRRGTALQVRDPLLQDVLGRVDHPGVGEPDLGEREQVRRVTGVVEDERRALVDRHRAGTRRRIRLGAGMDLPGLEAVRRGLARHGFPLTARYLVGSLPGRRLPPPAVLPPSCRRRLTCPQPADRAGRHDQYAPRPAGASTSE